MRFRVLAHVIDLDEIGMPDFHRGGGLARKAAAAVLVGGG